MKTNPNLKSELKRLLAGTLASIILVQSVFAYSVREPKMSYYPSGSSSVTKANPATPFFGASALNKEVASPLNPTVQRIEAIEKGGIIGLYAGKQTDNPADNIFHFSINQLPEAGSRLKLTYDLQGVADYHGVAISFNDAFAVGGTWGKISEEWTTQSQWLDAQSVVQGENSLLFSLPENATYGYQVKNLRLEIVKGDNRLRLDNLTGLSAKGKGYVSGFIQGLSAAATLRLEGKEIPHRNGYFETILKAPQSGVVVLQVTDQKQQIKQQIPLVPTAIDYSQDQIEAVFASQSKLFVKGQKMSLTVGAATIEVDEKALLTNKRLSITPLRDIDMAAMDIALTNVTTQRGYRFLPHGEHFTQGALVKLGYDRNLLPPGYTEEDIRTFYFDTQTGHWQPLERDSLDVAHQVIISKTTHFTDMINGVIKTPESPESQGFAATMMNDIKAADPSAAVQTIAPPTANQRGSANLSYSIEVPPGRNGMQPSVGIQYNSDGGSGWLGEGWDLSTPSISVDTRWGVPRYSSSQETETYSMGGSMLVTMDGDNPTVAHRGDKIARKTGNVQFYPRTEGSFSKIIRKGNSPKDYVWEVTDKKGTIYQYQAVLKADNGNIAQWHLTKVTELHGDYITYTYTAVDEVIQGSLTAKALYLSKIEYGNKGEDPHSSIVLESNKQKTVKTNNARYGFLTSEHQLLTKATVNHLGTVLRSYDFVYKTGDGAFNRSLLEKVVQNDASGAKFNEHIFDYYDDVKASEGYKPFAANAEKWNTQKDKITGSGVITKAGFIDPTGVEYNDEISVLGGGKTKSKSFSLYVGIGLDDKDYTVASNTIGANFSSSLSESFGLLSLSDINGDGLADKIFKDGNSIYYRPNLGNNTFGSRLSVVGISEFSLSKSNSTVFGAVAKVGIRKVMTTAGTSKQNSKSTTRIYMTDVNSDGLVDVVRDGVVYFNHIEMIDGNPIPTFTTSSSDTPSPMQGGGTIDSSVTAVDPQEQADAITNSPLEDVVRVWEAPFAGTVKIESTATLLAPTGDYDTSEYALADGVYVGVEKAGTALIAKTALTKTSPTASLNSSSVTVAKGDKIYFRVQSGTNDLANGAFDQVDWNPKISYTDSSRTNLPTNPNGQEVYSYPATQGEVLHSTTAILVPQKANEAGAVKIEGVFNKPLTSDDVTVKVLAKNASGVFQTVWCKKYEATASSTQLLTAAFELPASTEENQEIKIVLSAETNLAWDKIKWEAKLTHFAKDTYTAGAANPAVITNCTGVHALSFTGASDFETHPFVSYELFAQPLVEGNVYTATAAGDLSIVPTLTAVATDNLSYKVSLSAKTSAGVLLGKANYSLLNGQLSPVTPLVVTAALNDKIWVEYHVASSKAFGTTAPLATTATVQINGTPLVAPIFVPAVEETVLKFGPMYRHWGQFMYNAMEGRYNQPIDESKLVLPESETAETDPRKMIFTTMSPNALTKQYWSGADDGTYIKANVVSSSRLGEDNVVLTNPLAGKGSAGAGTTNPYCVNGSGAFGIDKISKSKSTSVQAGVGIFTGSTAMGSSEVMTDFQDMNADGYPDIITGGKIQYTNTKGGFEGETTSISGFHSSTNNAYNVGAGGSPIFSSSVKSAQAKLSNATIKFVASALFFVGDIAQLFEAMQKAEAALQAAKNQKVKDQFGVEINYNKDSTTKTYADINGDGLPDQVLANKQVKLNLGYSFSDPMDYNLENITKGDGLTLNASAGLDIGSGSISAGYGISKSLSWTDFELKDVNADGLVDQVFKDGQVRLNLGDRYAAKMNWEGWISTNILGMGSLGRVSSTAESLNAAFTVAIPIPIIQLKIALNPGVNFGTSSNRTETQLSDIDGDGFPDYLTSTQDNSLLVKRSTIARTNKLKGVRTPLGAEYVVDYGRSTPSYDHPNGKWVMSSVLVKDGIASDGPDMKTQFVYNKGKQERHEREFLGFGEVKTQSVDTQNGNAVYRTLTQTYDVSDIYSSGNLLASVLESGEGGSSGKKYTENKTNYHTYEVKATGDSYRFAAVAKVCSDRGIGFTPTQHTESWVYEGGSTPLKTNEIDYEYYVTTGSYGDLKTYKYKDNSTGNYQTDISYTHNPSKHIFGLPTKVQVSSGGNLFRETTATYDTNFADHLTQISQTLNGTDKAVVDIKYDKYGNITQKTLPANYLGQRRFYKYRYEDDFKMYVEEITDNFDYHSFFRNYDSRYGVALETTDINGYTLTKKIDEFGRLTQVLGPKEAAEGQPYTIQMDYFPNATVSNGQLTRTAYARTQHYDAEHPNDPIETVTFVDGLGRAIQVKKDAALTNNTTPDQQTDAMIVSGRAKYDAFGRVAAAHYPQTAPLADWDKFLDSFDAVQPTQTTYDVLDRPLTTTLPDNSQTKMAYTIDGNLLKTEVTDALNNKKASFANGSGLTEKTVEEGNITTQFSYDPINQAINVTDAAGQQTLSTYDLAGRRTQLIHPDAGKSTYKFDAAGNLLERQTANLEAVNKKITCEYDYNRLTKIHYPLHPENDVRYVYGTQNEGNNRRGKVILQEDATGAQEFSYGITGEIEKVRRTLIAPNNAVATYVTQWKYDSWNRVQEMIYPDEEKITYDYNSGGLLQAIKGYKSYSYNYVNKLGYDKFEQRTYLKYCNGTETKYNYEPLRRRLDVMTVASGTGYQGTTTPRLFMNNKYVYDNVSNVLSVTNSAAGVASKMGGTMKHTYQYDNLYRLTGATGIYTGADQKTGKYDLAMSYDNLHNIVSKVQNVTQNKVTETAGLSAGYNLAYNYDSTKKHQLKNIAEVEYRDKVTPKPATPSNKKKDNIYTYDAKGNQIYVNTVQEKLDGSQDNKALEKTMLWDEENRLGAISINGYVSSYTYDASGERVSKLSGGGQGIFVNSAFSGGKTSTSDFTLYTSPYLVAQSGGRYTKHIYIGSQRIVSKLGDFDSYGADPRRIEKAGDSFNGVKVDYASKYKSALNVVKANYESLKVPYYGLDNDDYVNGLGFCCNPASSSTSPTAKNTNSKNDNAELQQYYYHPDHLGSSSYISNLDGEVVQHVEYVPFGEVFLEEKNAVWNTPYLFNGKELDKETGLSYYGARYFDSKYVNWLSVDPLAIYNPVMEDEFYGDGDHNGGVYNSGNLNSYGYCYQNPIRFVDPNGKQVDFNWFDKENSNDKIIMSGLSKVVNYSNTLQIGAHGNSSGIFPYINGTKHPIKDPHTFDVEMTKYSSEWKLNKHNENFTLILYSCRTAQTPTKDGVPQSLAFAKKLSKAFKEITIIAPDERIYVGESGLLGSFKAKYQNVDGEYNKQEYNIFGWSFGPLIKEKGEDGAWNVYKNGSIIKRIEKGDWTPKPINVKRNSSQKK